MNSLLFGISLSALLSTASLLIVLFRVSPLTASFQAVPAFFISLFLSVSSVMTLVYMFAWRHLPHHWDTGKLMSVSLRQGIFTGTVVVTWLLFLMLGLLTWWIALIITAVFVLIEIALEY